MLDCLLFVCVPPEGIRDSLGTFPEFASNTLWPWPAEREQLQAAWQRRRETEDKGQNAFRTGDGEGERERDRQREKYEPRTMGAFKAAWKCVASVEHEEEDI